MQLVHHDGRNYDVAVSEAAAYARGIMQKKIDEGRAKATSTFEHVMSCIPQDAIVRGQSLRFDANGALKMAAGGQEWGLHRHALGQVAARADIPALFVRRLEEADASWKRQLLAHNLNTIYQHDAESRRYLVRAINGDARGFLSDSYRRLDSRPLLDAFVNAAREFDAVPLTGTVTDTRAHLKVVLPHVFEPVDNEVMVFGLEWSNSDFGKGKHGISMFMWRLWCTNLATMESAIAQVHLGGKLPDNMALSEETYRLDTETTISAVKDIIPQILGPDKINGLCEAIKRANEEDVDWKNVSRRLTNVLTKGEQAKVQESFEGNDVQMLPPGKSTWRLSNAVSWLAGNTDSDERKLELERLAGQIIDTHAKEVAA